MRRLQLHGLLFLTGFRMAAQTCPAINFRGPSQVNLVGPGQTASGMQRLSDGSFTLHSYSFTRTSAKPTGTIPQFQKNFLGCSGHSPQQVVPPPNWSFLGASLLGAMPHNPSAGNLLNNPSTPVGLCLGVCNPAPGMLQMAVGTPSFTYSSSPSYTVSSNAFDMVLADVNNDGLGDVIVVNSDTSATLSVFLMQANGTLAAPTSIPMGSGDLSATAADFDGDGKIDLAVISSDANTLTILLGNGDGTFRVQPPIDTGTFPQRVVAADVTGDSKLDLVLTTFNGIEVYPGNGNGTFQAVQKYATPGFPSALAVADLNKDGRPDLVAVDFNDGVVLVLLNAGNGAFPTVAAYVVGFSEDITQVFLMDFDWDGNTDIVFGAGHPDALTPAAHSQVVTVLFGNGDGTFSGIPAYPVAGSPGSNVGSLAVGDFNGDGKLDAVAGSSSAISLLSGNGDGSFTSRTISSQQGSTSLAAGDFNHDGKLDFVATTSSGISVYLGDGKGNFQTSATLSSASSGLTGVAVGDFNGDTKLDFAVVDSQGGTSANALVYLGNGDGTFQSPRTVTAGSAPQSLQAVDVNGDNKLDLVVTNFGTFVASDPGSVAVLLGNGDGSFQPAVPYAAGTGPAFTLAADINGDGKPDLITSTQIDANTFSYGLMVRLNQGGGNFGAPQSLNADFGPQEIALADFNGDGKLDLLVAHCCGDTQMGYFLGNGNGSFQPEVLITSGTGQYNLRVADLNGDGKPDALFTLQGPYAASMLNISVPAGAATAITVQTSPPGLQFTVDGGAAETAPATVNLSQGSHTLAVASPQAGAAGTRYVFASWSDGGAASHSISVGAAPATYTATFATQYLLTTAVLPAGAGAVTANPSATYYNAATSVQLTASPGAGYQFSNWSGDLSGGANPQSIVMNAPHSVTANFSPNNSGCSFVLGPTSASDQPTGTSTVETCPNQSGQPNCGVTPETLQSFTVTPAAACGAWTATSSNPGVLQIQSGAGGTGASAVDFYLLNNTHTLPQTYTVTVASGPASATYTITEAGSGNNQVYREVYALYEQLLGRDPDPAGFAFWTGSGGAGLGQMADSFLTSPEAFNSDFVVMATYQATTGAPPTFAQYYTAASAIRAGAQTVTGLYNSLVNGSYSATTLYQYLLKRTPTAAEISSASQAGLASWFQTLIGYPNNTTPVNTPDNEFQSTGIYHTTLAADHTNGLYVQMLYYVILGRDPDPAGLAFWVGIANGGGPGLLFQGNAGFGTRIQILGPGTPDQGFIGSPEFQGLFAN